MGGESAGVSRREKGGSEGGGEAKVKKSQDRMRWVNLNMTTLLLLLLPLLRPLL